MKVMVKANRPLKRKPDRCSKFGGLSSLLPQGMPVCGDCPKWGRGS